MDKIIKNILKTIESHNFKAYLVGGYVRDYLLGIKSYDIDICTNALPKDLHNMFPNNSNSNNYGGFNLKINKYNIDITTFRKEITYKNRKPIEIEYLNDLESDIKRRDFTINSICMDKDEHIIDLVNGIEDLSNRNIKMLGNIKEKLEEDPLRILRAIRFSSTLNFNIDEDLHVSIVNNYKLVKNLSKNKIKEELNKVLLNKNFKKGLSLLKTYKILDLLNISYNDDIIFVSDICGMYAQINFSNDFPFTKLELTNIINIRQIIEDGIINNFTLYKYGLYNSLVASEILNLDKKDVTKKYNRLPIKKEKELNITSDEIMSILNIQPSKIIKEIKNDLINNILDNKLKNRNSILKKYIINKWRN